MIVKMLLLLNVKRNTENRRQVFKITFPHIVFSLLLFVCFFFLWRELLNHVLIFSAYSIPGQAAIKQNELALAKKFLSSNPKPVTLETADIGTLCICDQKSTGSPYCKQWDLSNVFNFIFHNVRLKLTFNRVGISRELNIPFLGLQ